MLIISCSKDKDEDVVDNTVTPPATYEFTRNGQSTVSFGGQTARLKMAAEIYSALKDNSSTKEQIDNMFNNGTGFSDSSLDASGKNIGSKTAASPIASATVKPIFDAMIVDFVDNVIPAWNDDAADGTPGKLTDETRSVYINAKGHEITQLFTKGLMGALVTDQILNNYLTAAKLDSGTNRDDQANLVLEYGTATKMEHYWDEGFGYLYGEEANVARADLGSNPTGNGVLVNKYFKKVNDQAERAGIAQTVYDAFKMGRAAIVAENYTVRDEQAAIIQVNLSKVIGYKAMDYLNGYVSKKDAGNLADAIHALSEGWGFILSLQFTNDGTGNPYFSNSEVNAMLAKIDNFWTVSSADCTSMANDIKTKMGL
tara:strand:- start:389 stop:1498 length:1110 start_codon:yes stop_codon:yes gene_type:complete